ncbi:MAG TPA: HAMP domain-containing sensor histidine kinase [Acidimicrobiales bacterium]|nr:HAMP domain-containing sensor histidine kinase [Acidimicrobiales bacterium]
MSAGDPAPSRGLLPIVGSIRFRLTVVYSLLLFGLASLVVAGIYVGVEQRIDDRPLHPDDVELIYIPRADGTADPALIPNARAVQRWANARALGTFRGIALAVLPGLFGVSLILGWFVAGRVLAPIGRITSVARDIQVTDLSRRIELDGPPDELRELADTFDEMLGRLDEAFEGQRRFIHEASHELRNPLAVIRANVDVALSDPDPDVESLTETVEVVQRSTGRISRLVDDLLAYADRGAPVHEHVSVDVAGLARATVQEFRASAEERDLQLVGGDVASGVWVLGDAVALRQVLANLLANAIRLAPQGTDIVVGTGRSGDWVWFAVDDAGPGIPEEHRDQVFKRFWRGSPQRARAEGRSGLGLTIARQIVEGHRGQVRVLSSDRGGSTFVVWLPATDASGLAPEPPDGPPAPDPEVGR